MAPATEAKKQLLLKQLKDAADRRAKARAEMEKIEEKTLLPLVVKAARAGVTMRDIGDAVGVSHVTIIRMLQRRGITVD